jgi:aminoglycoside phosphotransferase (APT) family kinase protein
MPALRAIVSFRQDEHGDFIAVLACGHTQHVRHKPPWQLRPWVTSEAGRAQHIGVELSCPSCDAPLLHPGTPPAEVSIDSALVAALLEQQHPDLARLPLRAVDSGWDNAMYRLGERWAVRLPRRSVAAPLIVHEQTWLPRLQAQLPLPVPAPYRIGKPALGYPWRWSVVPWLAGAPADRDQPHASQARVLAGFLRALHVPAPADAPLNPARGVPLRERAEMVEARIARLTATTDAITPRIRQIWQDALDAPIDVPPTWLHGDLHPRNVLVEHGVLTGIVDWGDITSGDRAGDLSSIFMLFAEPAARCEALRSYGDISHATLQRARGWAVLLGVALLDSGLHDSPRNAAIGRDVLRRVAEPLETP